MINDEYDRDIEATMDDLECLEFIDEPQSTKPTKYQMPFLPEIDENSTFETQNNNSQLTNVGCTSVVLSNRSPFRVPEVPITKMRASLGLPARRKLSQCKEVENEDEAEIELMNTVNAAAKLKADEIKNKTISNKNGETNANTNNNNISKNVYTTNNNGKRINEITGTKRKFIVTKMDSNSELLRPEAQNLRNLTEKSNAATIHFPCSSNTNQRSALAGLFPSAKAIEPHLDKRFFDSSLVEVRLKTNSTQSLNNQLPEKQELDSVWQRRKRSPERPSTVSIFLNRMLKSTDYFSSYSTPTHHLHSNVKTALHFFFFFFSFFQIV